MAVPFALMALGTGLQVIGQFSANYRQAKAQLQNAKFLDKQADFARSAMNRSMRIAEQEYATKYGQQASAYAGSGVDVSSGSASLLLANTLASSIEELAAIKKRGELDIELARSRANLNREEGRMLQSPGFNLLQAGGTFLSNYTASEGFGRGFPASFAPESPPPSGAGNQLTYFPQGTNRAL
jgi:hypothetical protein